MVKCPHCYKTFKLQPKVLYVGDEVHVKREGVTFTGFIASINTTEDLYTVLFPLHEKAIIEIYERKYIE